MTRALMRRLEKLEKMKQMQPAAVGKRHWIIGETDEELDAKEAEVRASPEWREGDTFTRWRIVDPPLRRSAA